MTQGIVNTLSFYKKECDNMRNIKLTIEYDGKDFNRLAKATR